MLLGKKHELLFDKKWDVSSLLFILFDYLTFDQWSSIK